MTSHQIQLLFVDLALILFLGRALGLLGVRFGQPPVVGEIIAGILLGPTLFHGAVATRLFPSDVRPLLTAMANLGVAVFMFGVGLELDGSALRGRGPGVIRSAAGSMLVPFGLGLAAAFYILHGHREKNFAGSVVFVGLALSITAFPVLARILTDRGLSSTPLGGMAIATAAIVDIAAWVGLALVQALAVGSGDAWRVALMVPFVLAMPLIVRPGLHRLHGIVVDHPERRAQAAFVVVVIGTLLSGAATEAMGMHFIFGAFLFGAALPRQGTEETRERMRESATQLTTVLLPVYFVVAGLNVNLGKLSVGDLARLGVIMAVAVIGKFGGTYLGARYRGLPPRAASGLAVLMNTRGLTELIVLGVGLQLGLLDGKLYSLMVAMAVITTVMTGPLLTRVYRRPVITPELEPRSSRRAQRQELKPARP
ncbi:cation:proton antiporter [Catenulispora rubra]|uniref:cation:proton antiporter n=1 Tax=Catenulispora rubra TaxID=280293 RepID=UPI001891FD8D|nr:cation:proton antiporter [Catenulispora rubra]